MKHRIKETIVVEGRYDKNVLSQIISANIIETSGFGVFSDKEKLSLLRRIAEKAGIVILTDSDGAGFLIRNYLKGALDKELVKHAYIPEIEGKERRKRAPGKEGLLGVEGMGKDVLISALRKAGATFPDDDETQDADLSKRVITKADLYELGLSGTGGSAGRRAAFMKKLGLPRALSSNGLISVLNSLYDYDTLVSVISGL